MPSDVSAITVKKIGALKHDKEGFVTPMKVKPPNQLIKVSFEVGQISLIVVIAISIVIQDFNFRCFSSLVNSFNALLSQVEEAMEALESPAPAHDTTLSSLNTVYKRNIANAMKKTAPPSSKILGGVRVSSQ